MSGFVPLFYFTHYSMTDKQIILFDGFCNLCSSGIQFIIKRDSKGLFNYVPLQSEKGKDLLSNLDIDSNKIDSIILISNGTTYIKSKAVFKSLGIAGGPWKLLLIFQIIPSGILDNIYDFIARNRYRVFGKRDTCYIPDRK